MFMMGARRSSDQIEWDASGRVCECVYRAASVSGLHTNTFTITRSSQLIPYSVDIILRILRART